MNVKPDFGDSGLYRETDMRFFRLKQAVEEAGGNAVVAKKAGIGTTTLSTYMNGQEWKLTIIEKIADGCGKELRWILFGDETHRMSKGFQPTPSFDVPAGHKHIGFTATPRIAPKSPDDRVSIRLFNVEASAGYGVTGPNVEEQASVDLIRSSLPDYVVSRLPHLVAVTVRGDSMTPSLYDGDIIFVDTKDTDVIPGCMYVLRRDNDIMVKRLTWTTLGDLVVSSDNPRFPAETVEAKRARALFEDGGFPVQVVGRVLWRTGIVGSL